MASRPRPSLPWRCHGKSLAFRPVARRIIGAVRLPSLRRGRCRLAHATDGGGSIRIPASLCGLFGLKPSRGRVSLAPLGETLAGLARSSASRSRCVTAQRCSMPLPAMRPAIPTAHLRPAAAFLRRHAAAARTAADRLHACAQGQAPLDPVLVAGVEQTAALLSELGHHVEQAEPELDGAAMGVAFGTVMAANTFTNIQLRANGRVPGRAISNRRPGSPPKRAARSAQIPTSAPFRRFHRTGRRLGSFFERYDILLFADSAHASAARDRCVWTAASRCTRRGWRRWCRSRPACNMTGVPAMSVPLAWTGDGLPIGMHFVGRLGAEEMLFSLAAQLEQARPWRERRPPLQA